MLFEGLEQSSGFRSRYVLGRKRAGGYRRTVETVPHIGAFTVLHSGEGAGDRQEKQQRSQTEGEPFLRRPHCRVSFSLFR